MHFLERLLGALSPQEFLRDYWQQKPVYLPSQERNASVEGLNIDLDTLISLAERLPGHCYAYFRDDGDIANSEFVTRSEQVRALTAAGMTIVLREAHREHAGAAMWLSNLKTELGCLADASSFAAIFHSPPGKGYGLHFDGPPVLSIQLSGSKTWRFGRKPAVRNPPQGVQASGLESFKALYPWIDIALPRQDELIEQTLNPGDALYLPSGTWHAVAAGDASTAISFVLMPTPSHRLVTRYLDEMLRERDDWRRSPALIPGSMDLEHTRTHTERLAHQYIEALKSVVSRLSSQDLAENWLEQLGTPGKPKGDDGWLRRDDLLRAATSLSLRTNHGSTGFDACLNLVAPDRELSLGFEARGFLEGLIRARRFRAADALAWSPVPGGYSWPELQEALQSLVTAGFVEHIERTSTKKVRRLRSHAEGTRICPAEPRTGRGD